MPGCRDDRPRLCEDRGGVMAHAGAMREGEEGDSGDEQVRASVTAVVLEYLAVAAGGEAPPDFTAAMPLMEAGLDSLDLLKARLCCAVCAI